jgi:hypothetical protein
MNEATSALADQRIKNWKRLLTSNTAIQVESIRIIESNIFAPQTIDLPRVLALIGLHGTGKTLLMRLLEAAFGQVGHGPEGPPFFRDSDRYPELEAGRPSPIEGIIEITVRTPNGLIPHVVDLTKSAARREEIDLGGSYPVWYTGPLRAFSDLTFLFQDYDDLGSAHRSSRQLKAEERRSIQNVLGRSYDRLSVHTVSTLNMEGLVAPYVTGIYQSREVDSSAMSNGELWVHYVSWWLQDNIPEGSLALIDEPEAFLAARGQRPFIDQIAALVLRKNMQLIVGTHSPEVLARFPLENIRMCLAGSNGIEVVEPTWVQIQDIVGMNVPVRGLVLVEDDLAKRK